MKSVAQKLRFLHRNPPSNFSLRRTSTTTTAANGGAALTEDELKEINAVVPRLCSSNHLKEAINLVSAALSAADPPLSSLPLPALVNRLAEEPDLTHPMHFLNALKHNAATGKPQFLLPVAKMFVSSYFQKGCPKCAAKIFQWVSRPDFPGGAADDLEFYDALVDGFCRNRMILDSIRVLRFMGSENLVIGSEIRVLVYRGLLREARVTDALEMNDALDCGGTLGFDGCTSNSKEVVDLLDRVIANWVE
ncbi:hypothetical protein ABFS83_04G116000 [Erythranthe nasuta]